MDPGELKALQAPLEERYREAPEAAVITLKAEGQLGAGVMCSVRTSTSALPARSRAT